jgi:hypothetical protein
MSSRTPKAIGLVAVPTALLLMVLAPIQSFVWGDGGPEVPAWIRSADGLHRWADGVWLRFGGSLDRYHFWGRLMVLTYLGALAGIWAFRRVAAPGIDGWRILVGALALGAVLDLGGYWGSTFEGPSGVLAGFEFFCLPVLLAGTVRYGWVLRRPGTRVRWPGFVLLGAALGVIPSMVAIAYWPHGIVLPVAVAAAVLAAATAVGLKVEPASAPVLEGSQPHLVS